MSEATAPAAPTQEAPQAQPQVQSTAPQADTAPSPAPAQEQRPSWLPEKFKTPEDLARAYAELEKKLGQASQAKPAEPPPQQKPQQTPQEAAAAAGLPDPEKINDADARFILAQRGLNADAMAAEYFENGRLSEQTYAALEKAGLPRAFVDGWIAGREALAEKHLQRLYSEVGGEEEFRRVQQWAAKNIPERELRAYNNAVAHGDIELMALAVRGMHARYVAAVGRRPQLVMGDTSPSATEGFASQAEAVKAMSDPRYRSDPAYRAEVDRKLAARQVFNVRVTR